MTFAAGQTVVLQEVWRERVWAARPMRVVRDDGDFVVLWFPRGTRWQGLLRTGDWHSLWVSWLPGFQPWGWYVNLQQPFRRSAFGFETMDLALDVIVEADRSWRWKDEDELALFVERGAFDADLPTRLREEGLRVAEKAERNEPPFSEPWHDWRPDRARPHPELPPGWDGLRR